ncbi:DUF1857-domain-containing protein [Mycena polygramma]|nr:DUF1857-domain-containing protein [Mycena polygramma]
MTSAFAATRRVNPPGANPVLTEEQLWRGLEYRARHATLFIPNVTASKIITDEGNKVVQELTVENEDKTETMVLTETITALPSTIMYYESSNGMRIVALISRGAAGELLLTFSFANRPLPPNKPQPTAEEDNARIGMIVEKTIAKFREMVSEGKL